MKQKYNLTTIFNMLIIAMFLFSLSGCGHKGMPIYEENSSYNDENVKFILNNQTDNNESNKTTDEI